MPTDLTKDADTVLCVLYRTYLERRKNKLPKSTAKEFDSFAGMQEAFFSKWLVEDVEETCNELKRADFLEFKVFITGDTSPITLSDKGIIYMENRFPNGLASVVDFLSKIIGPFL